jgi:hypothetical protein
MSLQVRVPDPALTLAERAAEDFGMFAFDGFGIMLTDEQLEARERLGRPGPRGPREYKVNFLSGGQRAGKTVLAWLFHAEACLYKAGVDNSSRTFWKNYLYKTLAIAPTNELTLRLYAIADEISKGASDAQFDRRFRRARGGAFLSKFKIGKSGDWPVVRFTNGSQVDFRSSEGWAYRLEGGQWWFISWDEWASQPDREIGPVLSDVLYGRARDHDAKIMPMAWPKPETEHHLVEFIRAIESGRDRDSQVIYLSAESAYFTNKAALEVERRKKSPAQWKRTVLGEPAGGASLVFTPDLITNMVREEMPESQLPEDGYDYFNSFDIGIAHDSTVGVVWRIPIVGGRRVATPDHKVRIVNTVEMQGGDTLTLDRIAFTIAREQQLYHAQTAVDATSMGGVAAFRQLRDMRPSPLAFSSRSNDRIYGNMRLAAVTNGLDCLSWGRQDGVDGPWGLVEAPRIQKLLDQLANFDPDEKNRADDWVWAFLIGLWYIRRYWAVGVPGGRSARPFDVRGVGGAVPRTRRNTRLFSPAQESPRPGVVYIRPQR